jgi:ketosteroid isomerase-like protein
VADRFVEALRKLEVDCDVGNVAVPRTFSGHDGLREFWKSYRDTFGEMRSEFRNVLADDAGHAALEWNTSDRANGKDVSYDGVSLLEIEDGKVSRFRACFDPCTLSSQVVD